MSNNYISNIEKEIEIFKESNKFLQVEKDMIHILETLMKLFHCFIHQNIKKNTNINIEIDFNNMKKGLIHFLEGNNYSSSEFKILKVQDFVNNSKYLSELMKNLCY